MKRLEIHNRITRDNLQAADLRRQAAALEAQAKALWSGQRDA